MEDWPITKSAGQCFGTGRQIKSDEEYFAALVETEQGFARRDYCVDFWNENKPAVYCFWKTKLAAADQKKKIFVDDEMLMSFFERLASETEQSKVNFRFVLALILMRKRRLKYDSTVSRDEGEIWHLKVAGENRFVDVVNPHLSEEQIEQLSGQLGQILQTDL